MTIALETEIVSTQFDPATGMCTYIVQRNGKHWTVPIHIDKFPVLKTARRTHIAQALEAALRGLSDEEKKA
jgi:hypothetical protein